METQQIINLFRKRECPLCKESMRTHRELRPYAKLNKILAMLKPLIDTYEQGASEQYHAITIQQMRLQQELKERQQKMQTVGTIQKKKQTLTQ
jgi:hypothetical protein